jgi:C-terminal processing protease CtpA/Prc
MQVVPLDPDDGSAVIVTVARYQTPSGTDINKKGIIPNLTLDAEALPADRICSTLASEDAPRLFK